MLILFENSSVSFLSLGNSLLGKYWVQTLGELMWLDMNEGGRMDWHLILLAHKRMNARKAFIQMVLLTRAILTTKIQIERHNDKKNIIIK